MASKGKAFNYGVACPLLSVDEAAARLGCAPMDLWNLIHAGECPGLIYLGRHYIEAGRLDDVLEVLTRPAIKARGAPSTVGNFDPTSPSPSI